MRWWCLIILSWSASTAFQQTSPHHHRVAIRRTAAESSPDDAALPQTTDGKQVRWLPPLNPSRGRDLKPSSEPGTMVLPLFPLGAVAYTPGSTQVLNIFEKRYRQMYSDILMSGGRRFVTTMVNPDAEGELAEVGVVLYLEDLKEVSQQTNDAIKYVVSHRVLDKRVTIHSVLNPADSVTRDTYMKCEVSEMEDSDEHDDPPVDLELSVRDALVDVADMQEVGGEDVRFSREAVRKLKANRGVGEGSLWALVELWKNFLEARAQAARRKVHNEVQAKLVAYLADKTGQRDVSKLPNSVNMSELPSDLQRELKSISERVLDDVSPLVDEQTKGVQRLLQATSHTDRLKLFLDMVENEKRRLIARRTLKATIASLESQFSKPSAAAASSEEEGVQREGEDDDQEKEKKDE